MAAILVGLALSHAQAGAVVIYVNDDASGLNDGTSWHDAFVDLQDALAVVVAGDEIWVAAGTYWPTSGTDRTATFQLVDAVGMYGGFNGTEVDRTERHWITNVTTLSGDIGVPDDPLYARDDCCHVVTTDGVGPSATLDGFVITRGFADSACDLERSRWIGGGIRNLNGSPTLRNLKIVNNFAYSAGGGLANVTGRPELFQVEFSSNLTRFYGAGIANLEGARLTLQGGALVENGGETYVGGGIYNDETSTASLADVVFRSNSSSSPDYS